MTHLYTKGFIRINEFVLIIVEFRFLDIPDTFKISFKTIAGFIMISSNQIFPAVKPIQYFFGIFLISQAKISQYIYGISLIDCIIPSFDKPLVIYTSSLSFMLLQKLPCQSGLL